MPRRVAARGVCAPGVPVCLHVLNYSSHSNNTSGEPEGSAFSACSIVHTVTHILNNVEGSAFSAL